MEDEQDGDAARLEPPQALEERFDAAWRQNRGRLVEDQEFRVGDERAGDLHPLLRLDRQVANAVSEARLYAKIPEVAGPSRLEFAPREDRTSPPCAELHRLGDGEGRRQGEALMDEFDTRRARLIDMAGGDLAIVDLDRAGKRLYKSGDDAGKSGLAGAVLPNDGMDELWRKGCAHFGQCSEISVAD